MNACNICQATDTGVLNAAALTAEQLDQLNTASGIVLQHVCAACIRRLSTSSAGQAGPVHEWDSKGAACWAAAQDGQRRFIHLGEKNKGDRVFRFRCAAQGCAAWRRVKEIGDGKWHFIESGQHSCDPAAHEKRQRVRLSPNVQDDVLMEAKRRKTLEPTLQHRYRAYATTVRAARQLSSSDLSASIFGPSYMHSRAGSLFCRLHQHTPSDRPSSVAKKGAIPNHSHRHSCTEGQNHRRTKAERDCCP